MSYREMAQKNRVIIQRKEKMKCKNMINWHCIVNRGVETATNINAFLQAKWIYSTSIKIVLEVTKERERENAQITLPIDSKLYRGTV